MDLVLLASIIIVSQVGGEKFYEVLGKFHHLITSHVCLGCLRNFCVVRATRFLYVKVGLSPSKKVYFICSNESPLKMVKNAFHFILKVLFVLKIFNFLS